MRELIFFLLVGLFFTSSCCGTKDVQTSGTEQLEPIPSEEVDSFSLAKPRFNFLNKESCTQPLTEATFLKALEAISKESSDDKKLELARKISAINCLKSFQVYRIGELFQWERSALAFAKYAYPNVHDKLKYKLLKSLFKIKSNQEEFEELLAK